MPRITVAALVTCLAWSLLANPVGAAGPRNVYFSSGSIPGGQIVRRESDLPAETKVFQSGKDNVARMFVIFGDFYAHTLRGELKAADGTVAKKLDWNLASMTSTASWRFASWGFNLQGLAPGEYKIDLVVDDAPAGTYGFTLK